PTLLVSNVTDSHGERVCSLFEDGRYGPACRGSRAPDRRNSSGPGHPFEGKYPMRRILYLSVLVAAASALVILPAGVAQAANNVLTAGSAGGTAVATGDGLTAGLSSGTTATFLNGSTGITCRASTFSATANSNPAAPGTAAESLQTQSFSNCT